MLVNTSLFENSIGCVATVHGNGDRDGNFCDRAVPDFMASLGLPGKRAAMIPQNGAQLHIVATPHLLQRYQL